MPGDEMHRLTRPPGRPRDAAEANDPDSWEADSVGADYLAAIEAGDLARCREIRERWAAWPGVIRAIDGLIDVLIDEANHE